MAHSARVMFRLAAPILRVRDVDAALAFYARMGFEVRRYGPAPYGFASRDGVELHLGQVPDRDRSKGSAYVFVDDSNAVAAEWRAAGGEVHGSLGTLTAATRHDHSARESLCGARAAINRHLNGFSSKVREQDVRGCLRPDCGLARVLIRGSGESTARESQAKRLSKVTDKAYFVRRLRARAGTVVAPGPHFLCVVVGARRFALDPRVAGSGCGLYTQATSRPARWLPCMDCGFLAADVQVRACPVRLCDRALRELALRVDPGTPLS